MPRKHIFRLHIEHFARKVFAARENAMPPMGTITDDELAGFIAAARRVTDKTDANYNIAMALTALFGLWWDDDADTAELHRDDLLKAADAHVAYVIANQALPRDSRDCDDR
jgi:hypothetical protein